MTRGCLGGLGRTVASACLHLGALLASALIAGVSFLLLTVVGPLVLGATRELILSAFGLRRQAESPHGRLAMGNPVGYALLSGAAWLLGYAALHGLWSLAFWLGQAMGMMLGLDVPHWLGGPFTAGLLFTVGAVVGLLVYRHERGINGGW